MVTDNVFFVIFALLPFHGWCCIFIINSIETDRLTLNSFTFSLLTSFFIPLFRSIMGLELGTISLMMLVNAGFSFPLAMIYTVMSEVNHHKGPIFFGLVVEKETVGVELFSNSICHKIRCDKKRQKD